MEQSKVSVRDFWQLQSCGEVYAVGRSEREQFEAQAAERYRIEPFIGSFARFPEGRGRDVLEIGVGMGADHLEWAQSGPRRLAGVDLTERAVAYTKQRVALYGMRSELQVADAERLPFPDASFDLVYSWGVLHHSPDTRRAVDEVYRLLRPGGVARIMIYHRPSIVGAMLWVRYALLAGRPWRSLRAVLSEHLESPGTKAYTIREARQLFSSFSGLTMRTELSVGDLMIGAAGQRHSGVLLRLARAVWPRRVLQRLFRWAGLYLLVEAVR